MRIAIFKPGIAAARSAFEAMSLLYRHCERRGAKVELFIDESDTFEDPELEITKLTGRTPPRWLRKAGMPVGPFYPSASEQLEAFDVIVTTDPFLYYNSFHPAYQSCRSSDAGLLVDVSLTFVPEGSVPIWRRALRNLLARHWSRSVDLFLARTPAAVERLRELGAVSKHSGRVRVIGHPVDTSRFLPSRGEGVEAGSLQALCVGRLTEAKGQLELVRAMEPLFRRHPELSLKFVGSGPRESALRALIRRLGLERRVQLLGEVPHGELPAHYRRADLFVAFPHSTPSWEEYFGVVYVEAMSSGLPVVSTRCGGIPYVVDNGETGYLVAQHDEEELQERVGALLTSSDLRSAMGRRARKRAVSSFSIDVLGERFFDACRAVSDD